MKPRIKSKVVALPDEDAADKVAQKVSELGFVPIRQYLPFALIPQDGREHPVLLGGACYTTAKASSLMSGISFNTGYAVFTRIFDPTDAQQAFAFSIHNEEAARERLEWEAHE